MEEIYGIFPKLAQRKDHLAGTMSGGEQQMLALGRALISQPAFLLADEISLGLAPLVVASLFEVLVRLNREGILPSRMPAKRSARACGLCHGNGAHHDERSRRRDGSGPAYRRRLLAGELRIGLRPTGFRLPISSVSPALRR